MNSQLCVSCWVFSAKNSRCCSPVFFFSDAWVSDPLLPRRNISFINLLCKNKIKMDSLNKALVSLTKVYPFSTQGIFPPDVFLKGSILLPSTQWVKTTEEPHNIPFLLFFFWPAKWSEMLYLPQILIRQYDFKTPICKPWRAVEPCGGLRKDFLQFMHLLCKKLTLAYKLQAITVALIYYPACAVCFQGQLSEKLCHV